MMTDSAGRPPYCYILNDQYKVQLAVRSSLDPLNPLYTPDTPIDSLPNRIESIVRSLTADWAFVGRGSEASARVDHLIIKVTPLHGPSGRHIAVFVENAG